MALPQALDSHVDRVAEAIQGVVKAVNEARYDRRTDEPDSGLTVGQAVGGINQAMETWNTVYQAFVGDIDSTLRDHPESESEVVTALKALSKLQVGVSQEVALAVKLDTHDRNSRLADIPDWPTDQRATLEETAFGPAQDPSAGLIHLMRVGTDDDPKPESPGQVDSDAVGHAVRVIRRQTAESINSVFVGLAAVPLLDSIIPLPDGKEAIELLRDALEEPASWAVEEVAKGIPKVVSRWSRWALRKATELLHKVLGKHRLQVLERVDKLLTAGATKSGTDLISTALVWVYDTGNVIERGEAVFDHPGQPLPGGQRRKRATRLRKLEESNKKWLTPIKLLSPATGHLWCVPIPLPLPPHAIPAAPAASAVLLAWTLLLSGDQLDTRYPFPDLWKGVVRRAQGE
jgi:hypothetical protein